MFETIKSGLTSWANTTTERQKLQHLYVVLLIGDVFIAGVVSLFGVGDATSFIYIALALMVTVSVNLVSWSLLKTLLLDKLPVASRAKRR